MQLTIVKRIVAGLSGLIARDAEMGFCQMRRDEFADRVLVDCRFPRWRFFRGKNDFQQNLRRTGETHAFGNP
jgi:hypothetical protein